MPTIAQPSPAEAPNDSTTFTVPAGFTFVEYEGGFLDGVRLDFHHGFNAALGESGVGKSTIIETMAHAVRSGEPPLGDPHDIVYSNLKGATVRVGWRNEFGALYVIERQLGKPPVTRNAQGEIVEATVDRIVHAKFYSQNAIQKMAKDLGGQMKLLDSFVSKEMTEIEREIAGVLDRLGKNATKLLELSQAADTVRGEAEDAAGYEEALKALQPKSGPDAAVFRVETEAKGQRKKEAQTFETADKAVQSVDEIFRAAAAQTKHALAAVIHDSLYAGKNGPIMRQLSSHLLELSGIIERSVAEIGRGCAEKRAGIHKDEKALAVAHAGQDATYEKVTADSDEVKRFEEKRDELQEKLARAMSAKTTFDARRVEREQLEERRAQLLVELVAIRERRLALRISVAAKLTKDLAPNITVTIDPGKDDKLFRDLLLEALANASTAEKKADEKNMKVGVLVDRLVEKFIPSQLAAVIARRDHARLRDRAGLDDARAARVIERIAGTPYLYQLDTMELADLPSISLQLDKDNNPNVGDTSTGQRGSVLLPILLLLGDHVVVIDQPEDHLFATFKSKTVARLMKEVKTRRQLIVMTHEPNLVILPHADRVFVLAAKGKKGFLRTTGRMEDLRELLQDLLDGGEDAFLTRKSFYGH